MGFFKKEQKEKKVETDTTKKGEEPYIEKVVQADINKEYPYIIQLYDIEDNTVIRRNPFGAKRYIEGANVFLVNEKIGFKEPFPKDTDEFKKYTISEIDSKIRGHEKKLEKLRKESKVKRTTAEEMDLMQEIKTFKGYKRSLELAGKGSYMIISADYGGRPLYQFNRIGNFKVPVFTNTDYSLRYMPLESDLATAGELLKLNDDKNGDKDNTFKLTMIGLSVILGIVILGALYFNYKALTIPIELTEGFKQMVDSQTKLTEKLGDIVQNLGNFTESIDIKTPEPTAVPTEIKVNS